MHGGTPPEGGPSCLPVADVDPLGEELCLFGLMLDRLRRRDDGQHALNVLDRRIRLGAEEAEIFFRELILLVQLEEKVGARRIRRAVALRGVRPVDDIGRALFGDDDVAGRAVALRGVRPVDDIGRALFGDDDVAGLEVAVAQLGVAGQTVEADVKIVPHGRGIRACRNFGVHLIAQMPQKRHLFLAHPDLQIDEEVKILILFFGMIFHHLFERFAFDEFPDDRPLAVDDGDPQNFGDVQRRLLDARLVERFVEDVCLRIGLVERLNEPVAVTVDFFAYAFVNKFHNFPP